MQEKMSFENNRKLNVKIAGRMVDLLGLELYGGPVPAVAELIANAWDADAERVEITVPEENISSSTITIRDYGTGMTFDEINERFLTFGYERRVNQGTRTEKNRPVMGRKGIGKLAGFGVARKMKVISVKERRLVEFDLEYDEIRNREDFKNFDITPIRDEETDRESGVEIQLSDLSLQRNINIGSFIQSMARRFSFQSEEMDVVINGNQLTKSDLPMDFRVPKEGWGEDEIPEFGHVKYWYGFSNETIKEPDFKGFTVYAHNRLAQNTPFFFNISGGFNGQVGQEYLTGQVIADNLDEAEDLIATDRRAVNWDIGRAELFQNWGQELVKSACANWKSRKEDEMEKRIHSTVEYRERISKLPQQEKNDVIAALTRISKIEKIDKESFDLIATSILEGVEQESVKKIIHRINDMNEKAVPEFIEAIKEWDIISSVRYAGIIKGKIEVIRKLKELIIDRTPEKSPRVDIDMQSFIASYPWVLGEEYEHLERPADREMTPYSWVSKALEEADREWKKDDDRRRFDLLFMKDDYHIDIIELMRPGVAADYDHVMRLNLYVMKIKAYISGFGTASRFSNCIVRGMLIADNLSKNSGVMQTSEQNKLTTITWDSLLDNVAGRYEEFLSYTVNKAPDDPRMKGIIEEPKDEV